MPRAARKSTIDKATYASASAVSAGFSAALAFGPQPRIDGKGSIPPEAYPQNTTGNGFTYPHPIEDLNPNGYARPVWSNKKGKANDDKEDEEEDGDYDFKERFGSHV